MINKIKAWFDGGSVIQQIVGVAIGLTTIGVVISIGLGLLLWPLILMLNLLANL